MSCWTHVLASYDVDTFIEANKDVLVKKVEEILNEAPKITGSERDADIFINVLPGHNMFTSQDCDNCKHYDTITQKCICDEEHFECPTGEYQSRVIITIMGDLRDRTKQQTGPELNAFSKFIKDKFMIRNQTISLECD